MAATSAWTERTTWVAAALVGAALGGALALAAAWPYDLVGLAAVVLVLVVPLALDAFAGLVTGLVGAALVIAARQAGGDWTRAAFVQEVTLTGTLLALGWLAGATGSVLRGTPAAAAPGLSGVQPAPGSLGMLTGSAALSRLQEEVERAREHRRPLTVLLVRTEVTDPELSDEARSNAFRTVARLVESLLPETAVPFALTPDQVGGILPEVDAPSAWELLGPVIDAAGSARFADRADGRRRTLADCADLHAGLAGRGPDTPDAASLLAAVRRAVAADVPASPASGRPGPAT